MINTYTEDLCLVVTERCNLNCSYCQSNKTFKRTMSWDCAKNNIDVFLSISETKKPSITFMGGEPFLAFDLIKKTVKYVSDEYPTKNIDYSIVTNGTLVHGDIQNWIKEHEENVQVVLSLDGIGQLHNLYRCNSLSKIDLPFFKSLCKPIVNSVFTPQTICNLADTVIELHKNGFLIKGFLADGESWEHKHIVILSEQLNLLISYYLENKDIMPISLLSQPLYLLSSKRPVRRCGTNKHMEVSVATDGTTWACHRCSPFENNGTWKIPEKYIDLTNAKHLLGACKTCFLEKICNACPASNASIKDHKEQAEVACIIRQLLFKANAFFSLSMLISNNEYAALSHMTTDKKRELAESAKQILETLS